MIPTIEKTITYPLVLDGGLSNQLASQGCDINHSLWTARLLKSDPDSIFRAHMTYLEAGAQCIITSSYQASIPGFNALGIDTEEARQLILKSVDLAQMAVERFVASNPDKKRPLIAASIGPYGAFLSDGSEYKGDYKLTDEELLDFHLPRIEILDTSSADFFACETIPSLQETRVLSLILRNTKKKSWVSFSCKDDLHISDGTAIAECIKILNSIPTVFAVGVNCTRPNYISGLIKEIKSICLNKKIVVYPNSGDAYDPITKSWLNTSFLEFYTQLVKEWIELGADIVGGCCQVGPDQIQDVARALGYENRN